MQKLCFFAKELGVPFELDYYIYYYGPYSVDLEEETRHLVLEGLLADTSKNLEAYSSYNVTAEGKKVLQKNRNSISRWQGEIDRLTNSLGSLDPKALELLATIKFARDGMGSRATRNRVVSEVYEIKDGKFDRDRIREAYKAMSSAGLLGGRDNQKKRKGRR